MHKDEYSPYKFVHHLDKIEQLKNGEPTVPLQVQIVPANVCNQNCTFCAYRMDGYNSNETFNDREMLDYDKLIETLDCLAEMGVKAIQFTGGGEPLVHPRIKDILRHTFDLGFDVGIVTNGMALDEELTQILSQASWVRISVDAANEVDYAMIRRTSKKTYDRVWNNIRMLVQNNEKAIIGVGYVVNRENYEGIVRAAQTAKEAGVDNFRISATFTPKGFHYFDGMLEEAKELALKAQELSNNKFTVFNLFNDRVKDNFEGTQDYDYCPMKDLQVYIGADYNVYTCCTLAYNNRGLIGSIKDQTFKELWESDEKLKLYAEHNPRKKCPHPCMYKNKNEFINYTIKQDPKHVNFI